MTVSDDLFGVGERIFVKSTAIVSNGDKQFQSVGFAELDKVPVFKTGNQQMQVPQWTGAVSSYARKYALQGLFGIGEKDVDEYPSDMNEAENQQAKKANDPVISVEKANYYLKEIAAISVEKGKEDGSIVKWFLNHLGVVDYKMIKQSQIEDADILLAKLKGN